MVNQTIKSEKSVLYMNYFVNVYLGDTISGIEEAQFKRLQLFKDAKIPAKILYLGYNSRLYEFSKKFDVLGSTFSMYDYFQGFMDYSSNYANIDWRKYWEQQCHYRLQYIDGTFDIRVMDENDIFIMYAHFLNKTYTRIDYINFFNRSHAKIRRDVYDSRGYLSRTSFLSQGDQINTEVYYDQHQKVRLIKNCRVIDGRSVLRKITLKNYHQRDYFFDSENELRTFFLNELFRTGDMYYCDRTSVLAIPFYNTKPEVQVAAVIHSTHVRAGQDVITGVLKHNVYEFALEHPEHWNRLIVSTEQQRQDLLARFKNLPPVVAIPVGYATPHQIKFDVRKPYRLISVARYSPEKQLMHQIQAVEQLLPEFPELELHLLGHGNKLQSELTQYVRDHQLIGHVFLRGFQTDLTAEYQKASLALLTSREESFSIATLEALSFDVPVVSYDINYGPSAMIKDGENGFLVPANDQKGLVQKIREYLTDQEKQTQMMKNCEPLLAKFSPEVVRKMWQDFVHDEMIMSGVTKE